MALTALAVMLVALLVSRSQEPGRNTRAITPTTRTDSTAPALVSGPDRPFATHPVKLTLVTHPEGAAVTLTSRDGSFRHTGNGPWEGEVPSGHLELTLDLAWHEGRTQAITLDRDRRIEVWLDPSGLLHRSLVRFGTGSNPKQVAFSPDGKEIWVTLLGGKGVEVFSAADGAKLGHIELGRNGAVEVIFTKDGRTAFASQMETASVYEIDCGTRQVRRQMQTGGAWTKVMALSSDERTLYAANWSSDDVSEIDLATGKVNRRLSTVRTPRGLYPTPDGRALYVAGYEDGQIQKIDLATGEGTVLLETGGAMRHLVGDPVLGRVYADDMATDEVFVVDLTNDRVEKLAATDEKPNTIDLSPDGRVLYVSNRGENGSNYYLPGPEWGSVLAIDTATGRVLDAIVGGNQTTGLDVSPDGRILAFSDFLDNRVRLYAIPDYAVLSAGNGGRAQAHLAELAKR